MAQSKTSLTPSEAETKKLSEQMESLKADIATISQTLVDMGADRRDAVAKEASEKVAHLRKRGEHHLQDAQARAEDMANQATDAVREQPAAAVGLAVGLGFILGFLTGRK